MTHYRMIDGEVVGRAFCGGCEEQVPVAAVDGRFAYEYGNDRGLGGGWGFECSICGDTIKQNDVDFIEYDWGKYDEDERV